MDKKIKPEFLLKTSLLVVEQLVVTDAMVDFPQEPGTISRETVLLPEDSMVTPNIADLTSLPLATITSMELMALAEAASQLPNVSRSALLIPKLNMTVITGMLPLPTVFPPVKLRFKPSL